MPKFSLQTALDVRERVEKLKQKAFAEELQVSQKIKGQIETIKNETHSSQAQLKELKHEGFTIAQLQFHGHYQNRLSNMTLNLENQLKEHQEVVDVKQQELIEATQNRRALEILKEKELKRFLEKRERRERAEMDEIALRYSSN